MENKERPELIVCAACILIDISTGMKYQVLGVRHYDLAMYAQIDGIEKHPNIPISEFEQGFITNFGRFVNRKEALEIAKANNQIKFDIGYEPDELYSEMLY